MIPTNPDQHVTLTETEVLEVANVGADVQPEEALTILQREYNDALLKAWDNLARYKFSNFGYWSSRVVFLGQLIEKFGEPKPPNPFAGLVRYAREVVGV